MRITLTCILFFIITSFIRKEINPVFRQLHVLQGSWISNTKRGVIGEQWVRANDSSLNGKGFFVKGTDTITTEIVSLIARGSDVYYTSIVKGQNDGKKIPFRLTSSEGGVFIFENPLHDYPKRIVYELPNADSLHAYIDAGMNDTDKRRHFFYHKVK